MENPKDNIYFPALTGYRAIAAYMVYFHHFNPFKDLSMGVGIRNFVNEMHVGVTLFFVLSGFLIGYRYLDSPNLNFRKYMVNRIARIYPMYFLLTTATFLFYALLKGQHSIKDLGVYAMNITFIRGYFDEYKNSGIAQGWSLTVEETFYFLAPIFFILLKKSRSFLFTLPAILTTFGVILVYIFSRFDAHGFMHSYEFLFNYTFFGRTTEFFAGIALALAIKHDLYKRKTRYMTWIGVFFIVLSIYWLSVLKGDAEFGIRQPMGKVVNTLVLPLCGIVPLLWGLIKEKTILATLLGSKPFVLLGKSSYIFYLIHMGVVLAVMLKFIQSNILVFIFMNIISIVMFTYLEEPLNTYFRKKLNKPIA